MQCSGEAAGYEVQLAMNLYNRAVSGDICGNL